MTRLPLAQEVVDEALQGSYCPKLCTFACPVAEATGRDDAVPWSFHRAVTDLASGRRGPEQVADDLVACTGCLACQDPCVYDQDIPAQIREARQVARPTTPDAQRAVAAVAAGARPSAHDQPPPATPEVVASAEPVVVASAEPVVVASAEPEVVASAEPVAGPVVADATVLHAGCHADAATVAAAERLLTAAGRDVVVVDDGCCGQAAADLGDVEVAAARQAIRARQVAPAAEVVLLDPHCGPSLATATGPVVRDLWSVLADGDLPFDPAPGTTVSYHDPCLLARRDRVITAPRRLLAAAGYTLVEPEFHGAGTACSGAGLGLPLLDPSAASATAARRAGHLAATGAAQVATACGRAGAQLRAVGSPAQDLAVLLAERLMETP